MRISELAAATNEPPRTLRFYEAEGLLSPVRRTPSGYRDYEPSAVDQVRAARALQHAGLSLADIATLIRIRDNAVPYANPSNRSPTVRRRNATQRSASGRIALHHHP